LSNLTKYGYYCLLLTNWLAPARLYPSPDKGLFIMIPSIAMGLALSMNILLGLNPALEQKTEDLSQKTEVQAQKKEEKRMEVWVTAYSSTPDQTDDSPFITAANTPVRHGVIAANFLPFGTEIKIPEIFGEEVFTVEDRMHRRKKGFIDIWMPTRKDALKFGIQRAEIVILEKTEEKAEIAMR